MAITADTLIVLPDKPGRGRPRKRKAEPWIECGKALAAYLGDGYCIDCIVRHEAHRRIRRGEELIRQGRETLAQLAQEQATQPHQRDGASTT